MTQANNVFEVGVIHGRFQVLHNDHMQYLMAGVPHCQHLIVGITNAEPEMVQAEDADPQRSSAAANPLTYYERYQLVRSALVEYGVDLSRFSIVPLPISHPERYCNYVPLDAVFFLSIYDDWGRQKREYFESLGLQTFVLRDVTLEEKGISGTDVRQLMKDGQPWKHLVPTTVAELLEQWNIAKRLRDAAVGDG
jgi:nicotinamide-nucleotide adenylyltransferase